MKCGTMVPLRELQGAWLIKRSMRTNRVQRQEINPLNLPVIIRGILDY